MVQIRNCFYRGADRTSFAPKYPPWYIEQDVKTKHVKSRFIWLTLNGATLGKHLLRRTLINSLAEFFLGRPIPLSELDHPDDAQPKIESYVVDRVVNHRSGRGPKTPYNYRYRLRLRGYGPESGLEYRADKFHSIKK